MPQIIWKYNMYSRWQMNNNIHNSRAVSVAVAESESEAVEVGR